MHFMHGKYFISPHHFNTLELTAEPEIILVSIIINIHVISRSRSNENHLFGPMSFPVSSILLSVYTVSETQQCFHNSYLLITNTRV